jgi:N-acyl-D-aspartate/D-glutamate deacylase
MTLVPAQVVEAAAPDARRKGRLQPGRDADVVVFDPDTVTEAATYHDPREPPAACATCWSAVSRWSATAGSTPPCCPAGRSAATAAETSGVDPAAGRSYQR